MAPAAGKRVVAITQIAMFDAINSIERRYQPDLSQLLAAATASKEAAAAAAARIALAGLLPQGGRSGEGNDGSYLVAIRDRILSRSAAGVALHRQDHRQRWPRRHARQRSPLASLKAPTRSSSRHPPL
jgi:hypothetical protein